MCAATLHDTSAAPATPTSRITSAQLELGISLLRASPSAKNLLLSPYSIHAGLSLARIGAAGATRAALDRVVLPGGWGADTLSHYAALHAAIQTPLESGVCTLANSIWISDRGSFTDAFVAEASKGFRAEVRTINFESSDNARRTINEWVSSKTNSLIPSLLPASMPDPKTSAALVNALYFKAAWDTTFPKELTRDGDFHLAGGDKVRIPMMQLDSSVPYFENSQWQAVQLAYDQEAYTYLLLVPRDRKDTDAIVRALSPTLIQTALQSAKFSPVLLSMPRHQIRHSSELTQSLRSRGITLPFSSEANYSAMTKLSATIGAIVHEAVVQVDEAGTEAAAATAMIMAKSAFIPANTRREIKADHPFAFAIIHSASRAPLFIGVVGDPRGDR